MKGRGRRGHTSAFGRRWACPESARDDYARVISDRKWPLKKRPIIAHITNFLTKMKFRLPACMHCMVLQCIQLDYVVISGQFFFLLSSVLWSPCYTLSRKKKKDLKVPFNCVGVSVRNG